MTIHMDLNSNTLFIKLFLPMQRWLSVKGAFLLLPARPNSVTRPKVHDERCILLYQRTRLEG